MSDDTEHLAIEVVIRTKHTEIRMGQDLFDETDDETVSEAVKGLGNAMARFVNPEPDPWSEDEE